MSAFRRRSVLLLVCVFALLLMASSMHAQAPIALPSTISTYAGGGAATTKGAPCTTGSPYTATDIFGDGCPAALASFSSDLRGGLVVDGQGNVFVADTNSSLLRKIDAKTGIVNKVVGGGVVCGVANGQLDSVGSGCSLSQTVFSSNMRGVGIDTYGNVFIAGYNTNQIFVACLGISPLCPGGAGYKQVGSMYRIAGCVSAATGAATAQALTTAGSDGDGTAASPFNNLANDVAAWGSGNGAIAGGGTCSPSGASGGVNQARGVAADKYGNVYIADTANNRYRVVAGPASWTSPAGVTINNPLAAILALDSTYSTATAVNSYGKIFPILGGFTAVTTGNFCTGSSGPKSLSVRGDGCPFYETSAGAGAQGIAVDSSGNVLFADNGSSVLRVMYVTGTAMACLIEVENATTFGVTGNDCTTATSAPVAGSVYVIAGTGTNGTGASATVPSLASSTNIDSNTFKVTVDTNGNIIIGDVNNILFLDTTTGFIRKLASTGTVCAAKLDTIGDGCPASQATWAGGSGLGVGSDPQGNLYITDTEASSLIRRISASNLVAPAVGSSLTQTLVLHGAKGTTAMTAALAAASPDITVGSVTCGSAAADTTRDCTVPVTFAPLSPGLRSASLIVTPTGSTGVASLSLASMVSGSALVTDSTATATAVLGSAANSGSGLSAVSVAVDGSGNIYTMDTRSSTFTKITSSGTVSTLPGTLPGTPGQIAVDGSGNIYAVGGGNTITKLTQTAAGTYSSSSITVTGSIGVTGISVTAAGSGYTSAPGVVITGGGCTGVVATTTLSGTTIGAVNVLNAGTCTSTPTISFAAPAGTGATATATGGGTAVTPVLSAIAVDVEGNIYVADNANGSIYEIPAETAFVPSQPVITLLSRGSTPNFNGIAIDGQGNIGISDHNGHVYRVSASTGIVLQLNIGSIVPTGVAGDAAGDTYVQDATSNSVIEFPGVGTTVTVLSGLTTPTGIAVDTNGVLYSADSSSTGITQVQRNAVTYPLGTNTATVQLGTVTNAGNLAATGIVQTSSNVSAFSLAGGTTNGCASAGVAVTTSTAVAVGKACTLQATLSTAGTGAVSDAVTFNETATPAPAAGSLTVTGTLTGTATGTTTTISGETPASPLYVPSGTTVSFTVTVAPVSGTTAPTGTVSYTLDSNAPVTGVALTTSGSNGVGTIALSGVTAGSHTLIATYPAAGAFATSTSSTTTNFSVGQASTTVTWTPGASTQVAGVAIGTSVLNATAVTTVGSVAVAGAVNYTATPSGGSAGTIDASSYLALGTYTLGATFTPTDAVDYAGSTGSGGSYNVTQASTTAPVGASQVVVAADGTGNYTTVQSAINAVGASGGSIYIKPGTYNGLISVMQPNVSLRGLGGDPTAVVLTHSGGAFSVNPGSVYNYTAEFTAANSNGAQLPSGSSLFSGDQGSSTMVVAKGTNTGVSGSQLLPYNFYAENLTVNNTYNTDTVTTTTTQVVGSVCTANAGAATSYNTLFNAGKQCASQALAIWVTGDQAIFNNVYTGSLQDTVYAGSGGCGSPCTVSRQYWWRGKIAGNVDYIFGDAAAVFDHDNIYTLYHSTATGTETIEAQNKSAQTGSGSDYLSGYVFNRTTFTSQSSGMTALYYGRPYGTYSTSVMLNSYVDQVAAVGWIEFSGDTNLPTSTYTEYNTTPYTDPATGTADLNGVIYIGTGGSSGTGVTGTRETTSQDPGTPMASNAIKTQMTAAQAAAYYPLAFLGTKVGSGGVGTLSAGSSAIWNPLTSLTSAMNAFVPSGTTATVNAGGSITILMRPQTPGGGILPTGTYTLLDGATQLASGTLDASGEAYYTTSALSAGSHSITWTYGGDANYAGSTTSAPLTITVTAGPFNTTTTLAVTNASSTYGTAVTGSVTVAPTSGSGAPTGTVSFLVDSVATGTTCTLNTGSCTFSISNISAGSHTLTASYGGDSNNNTSTSTGTTLTVAKASLTVAAVSASRIFGQANPTLTYFMGGFVYSDTQGSVTNGGAPSITTSAVRISPVGPYTITAAAGAQVLTSNNYNPINYTNATLTVNAGAAQTIKFLKLPPFPSGASYQLAARASSGLPVTYTITAGSSNASVSGTTLTVNAGSTGVLITVQAAQTGNSTYAAATSVSQSFTAQ